MSGRNNKFEEMNEEALVEVLKRGNLDEEEFGELVSAMEKRGLRGQIVALDSDDSTEWDASAEYIEFHKYLPKDCSGDNQQIKQAINKLESKKVILFDLKIAILILAHSGRVEALRALQKFAEKAPGELKVWVDLACGECEMFLKSDLSDRPMILVKGEKMSTAEKISRVLDGMFNLALVKEEMDRAMSEFFCSDFDGVRYIADETDEDWLMEWLTYDFRLSNGKTVLEEYCAKNPDKLGKKELAFYEDLQMNKYGLFEVFEVKLDKWIKCKSLQSGRAYTVTERIGTHGTRAGDIMIGRIGKVGDQFEMVGSNPISIAITAAEAKKKFIPSSKTKLTPKEVREILKQR